MEYKRKIADFTFSETLRAELWHGDGGPETNFMKVIRKRDTYETVMTLTVFQVGELRLFIYGDGLEAVMEKDLTGLNSLQNTWTFKGEKLITAQVQQWQNNNYLCFVFATPIEVSCLCFLLKFLVVL